MISELIKKYFSADCSGPEKRKLAEYFRENASEISDYFSEEEWDSINAPALEKTEDSELFLNCIIADNKPGLKYMKFVWVAAAALTGVIVCVYCLFFVKNNTKHHTIAQINNLRALQWMIDKNETDTIAVLHLPDASIVKLLPGSEIKYLAKFDSARRDVFLKGEAFFDVQKEVHRSFNVYCREVVTTALGTQFKVSSRKHHVSVILFEGKVVVKSLHKKSLANQQYFLLPGNGVLFNEESFQFILLKDSSQPSFQIHTTKEDALRQKTGTDKKISDSANFIADINNAQQAKGIEFKGVLLNKVLSVLAEKRGIKIVYPTDKIAAIQFVGIVKDDTPVQKVLSDIALMNNFELSVDSSGKQFTFR